MDKSNIVINMLEYANRVQDGATQASLLADVSATGATGAEIRREYIQDYEKEMAEIHEQAQLRHLRLFYSVPDEVFVDGQINPKLTQYLDEGQQMGIFAIKFNIGDFAHFTGDLVEALKRITTTGIQVNIENDQTQTSGTSQAIQTFMKAVKDQNIDLGYVYDLGNWRFVGEDETLAAKELVPYVRYIHLKDVVLEDNQPVVRPLDEGILNWRGILDLLPKDVPIAIEYPAENNLIVQAGVDVVADYEPHQGG